MKAEMKLFLQEGIGLYVEAQRTLVAFEREMVKLLGAAVHRRPRWSPLKNRQIGKPRAGGGGGEDGWWVGVFITGLSPRQEEAEIDCSLWWDAPEIDDPIVYARSCHKKFTWAQGKEGISSFQYAGSTFLYVPVPRSVEIEKPLNRLLDALLKQLR